MIVIKVYELNEERWTYLKTITPGAVLSFDGGSYRFSVADTNAHVLISSADTAQMFALVRWGWAFSLIEMGNNLRELARIVAELSYEPAKHRPDIHQRLDELIAKLSQPVENGSGERDG